MNQVILFSTLSLLLASAPARAESALEPVATSQAEEESFLPSWLYSDFFTNYHGSSLAEISSSKAMTAEGKAGAPKSSNFDSEYGAGVMLGESMRLGAIVPFQLYPTERKNFVLGDAGLKISRGNAVSWRGAHLAAALVAQAPTSTYSRNRGMKAGVKAVPTLFFTPTETDFFAGAWNEVKAYLGATSGPTFKVWTLPYLGYRLSRSLSLTLGYELDLRHFAKAKNYLSNYQHDLQPGLSWKVTRAVSVNPYLELFRLDKINANTVGFGTTVSATLL